MTPRPRRVLAALLAVAALFVAGCDDDGTGVRQIGDDSGSASGSGHGSGTGSGSASGTGG